MIAIWIAFAVMAALVLAYLVPSFMGRLEPEDDAELNAYFAQIEAARSDDSLSADEASETVAQLQRQILERRSASEGEGRSVGMAVAVLGAIGFVAALIYVDQGVPLTADAGSQVAETALNGSGDPRAEMDALLAQLEQRLRTDSADDPTGWTLYARSLMSLGRFEEALDAYTRAVSLSDDASLQDERESAIAFVAQSRAGSLDARPQVGPTQQDMDDAAALSETDRAAMIDGMVEGLAARLATDPDDPEGWARLIRARLVLGQTEQAAEHVETVREVFAADDMVADILSSAGWTEAD
ncbi:MAG: hypothetical protein AAF311_11745 [Pseudomonadota bacterium]